MGRELLSTGPAGPGSFLLIESEDDTGSDEEDRPEVIGDLGKDLGDEDELVCEGHVEVFLNHVSIMSGDAGKGTNYSPHSCA